MFIDGKKLYEVLERCNDLFPEWKKEGNQYWNSKTGEIIQENGLMCHDLVNRTPNNDLSNSLKEEVHYLDASKWTSNNDIAVTLGEDSLLTGIYQWSKIDHGDGVGDEADKYAGK